MGDLLDGAFSTLRLHWRAILLATFAIALVTEGVAVVVQGLFLDDTRINDLKDNPDPSVRDILHAVSGSFAALGLTSMVTMIGTGLATGLLALVAGRSVLGRTVSPRDLWRDARPRVPQLLGLTLLVVVVLGAVLTLSALPGILVALAGAEDGGAALGSLGLIGGTVTCVWLWVQWSLAAPALTLEKQGVVAAMKRSAKLVRNSWWRVIGIQIVAVLIATLMGTIVEIPFSLIGSAVSGDDVSSLFGSEGNPGWTYLVITGVGQVLSSTITLPISAGVTALLYMDQRIRRESLDLDLVRAAAAQTDANTVS
ncbi:glycerophosphoryl diester phosphodiesterase membrane domain-containing protein [Actinacidiphila sp. ITFR-21]|uniref:glycerophosphoryl diester phosphodiesterase membrane domain-containing protein n=1 Tax=Actinacidiphila sp. ITFR-21 TaxID=3075199 RepID=UPI00288A7B4F|nr:glycerophosphoryl diester phosphodiesterase membrane domain-containing protein [Streptomyces sp. ITFR-21]WNI15771.1 glycerophosphoryl diester phosphodiesterase membrane domain-containing protein [Streptomyces sp. ITFR-21]